MDEAEKRFEEHISKFYGKKLSKATCDDIQVTLEFEDGTAIRLTGIFNIAVSKPKGGTCDKQGGE